MDDKERPLMEGLIAELLKILKDADVSISWEDTVQN